MPTSHSLAGLCRAASAAALLAALLVAPAHGVDKKAAPAPSGSKTPILTPEQLRDCLTQEQRLRKDEAAALNLKAEIDAAQADLDRTGAALADEATTLDRTNEEAVATHNVKVLERNSRVDAKEAKAVAYNKEAESFLARKEVHAKACANRRYDDRDLNDIQRKK